MSSSLDGSLAPERCLILTETSQDFDQHLREWRARSDYSDRITEADWRLLTTLVRFDAVQAAR